MPATPRAIRLVAVVALIAAAQAQSATSATPSAATKRHLTNRAHVPRATVSTEGSNGGTGGRYTNKSMTTTISKSAITSTNPRPNAAMTATIILPSNLLSVANSVITHYFPSTTPNNLASASLPSTVVIGTATYGLGAAKTKTTSRPTTQASKTGHIETAHSSNQDSFGREDRRLAIILGVVLGTVALAIMATAFWCLARRRRRTGSFYKRRATTPSAASTRSRMAAAFGARVAGASVRSHRSQHYSGDDSTFLQPAILHRQSSRSSSDEYPFFTPLEGPDQWNPHELEAGRQSAQPGRDRQGDALRHYARPKLAVRPPTPLMPAMMQRPTLPFQDSSYSTENYEAHDVVSPILPQTSFERRSSSMVHYPSLDEVGGFDFAGNGRKHASDNSLNRWHPSNERRDGRHEMA